MQFGPAMPILRIFDEAKAREFYVGFPRLHVRLGASLRARHVRFTRRSRAATAACTSRSITATAAPGARFRIAVDGLDAFHAELIGKKYKLRRGPGIEDMPWGTREMTVDRSVLQPHHLRRSDSPTHRPSTWRRCASPTTSVTLDEARARGALRARLGPGRPERQQGVDGGRAAFRRAPLAVACRARCAIAWSGSPAGG